MRIASLDLLRPAFARSLSELMSAVRVAGLPMEVFETIRAPLRQEELYARGRDAEKVDYGRTCTAARAYESAHQFGLAADIVFRVNGEWTWEEPSTNMWIKFSKIVRLSTGLSQLHNRHGELIEQPHVQLAGFNYRNYEPGPMDTDQWLDWLSKQP
jgi:hypothetical protein